MEQPNPLSPAGEICNLPCLHIFTSFFYIICTLSFSLCIVSIISKLVSLYHPFQVDWKVLEHTKIASTMLRTPKWGMSELRLSMPHPPLGCIN